MKKAILTVFILGFAAFSVSAQVDSKKADSKDQKKTIEQRKMEKERMSKEEAIESNKTNPQEDNPNAPIITFDKLVHDYGTLSQHGDGTCEFKFTNNGREPLVLSKVKSS